MRIIISLFSIFLLSNSHAQWAQKGSDIDGEAANDNSGTSVSISGDGNTLAVGAPWNDPAGPNVGHVRVYNWDGSNWYQKGADIDGEAIGDYSGHSVSISSDGNTIAIGAPSNSGLGTSQGQVRVYFWNGTNWIQKGIDIDGESDFDQFGWSVSLDSTGNTLLAGAPNNDATGANAGQARIFIWDGLSWIQKGTDINGEAAGDQFGESVHISSDGNTVIIGADENNETAPFAGHARVFEWSGTAWTQKGTDIDGLSDEHFGHSVSINSGASTIAIGGTGNTTVGPGAGKVRVYTWSGTAWNQKGADIDAEAAGDQSGYAISISSDGNILAIGGLNNDGTAPSSGHVRIYEWNSLQWVQKGADIDGEEGSDQSGNSVSLSSSGNTVAIGAWGNDDAGSNAGQTRVYRFCGHNSSIDSINSCAPYTWIDGITYTSSNNTAKDTLINSLGCDSIVTLNLTIINVDSSVTQTTSLLTANEIGATYQWLDCSTMIPLPGDTNQSFTPTTNGNYAVIVTSNGCTDTSACYLVSGVGIIENDFGNNLSLFPNPIQGPFTVDLGSSYNEAKTSITDLSGKLIQTTTHRNRQLLNIELNAPTGVYILTIESGGKKAVIRILKQ